MKIEEEMARSGFWSDRERAAERSQELSALKEDIERLDLLDRKVESLRDSTEHAEEDAGARRECEEKIGALEKECRAFEVAVFFSGKYDKGNAVVSVHAGAGGKDAEDWAALLLRMFERYADRKGWKIKMIHEHWGEFQGPGGWGIKNATIVIAGAHAYGYLKKESGVHRLVRISPFSSQKLRHTSFALVDVMPEFVAPEEVEIRPEDLKIDFFRSSGPGGQNVNKRETAVRITHLPTGLQVASQAERSQEQNRSRAMGILRGRLYQIKLREQEEEEKGVRQAVQQPRAAKHGHAAPALAGREKVKIEWGSQVRSYVMHPYQMVKDHRTGTETSQIDAVLDGELDEFIETEIKIPH